jgi:hypothetical protein
LSYTFKTGTSADLKATKMLIMKKFISLCFASFLFCAVSHGQETSNASNENTVKKEACVPTKACAEKAGISLEECKAHVQKNCSKSKVSIAEANQSATAVKASMQTNIEKKQNCNIEECAAKLGISVEECLKRCKENCCKDGDKTASTTKVASALMTITPPPAVKAEKPAKACCAKSKN